MIEFRVLKIRVSVKSVICPSIDRGLGWFGGVRGEIVLAMGPYVLLSSVLILCNAVVLGVGRFEGE